MYLSNVFIENHQMFQSPFHQITKQQEKRIFYFLLAGTLFCIVVLKYLDTYLINDVCKNGILSFEFIKTTQTAEQFLNSWNKTSKIAAGISLGFDFLFPIFYTLFLGILVHKSSYQKNKNALSTKLIYGLFLAGLFDYIENVGLINVLLGNVTEFWTKTAFYFASAKFCLICIAALFIIIKLIQRILK